MKEEQAIEVKCQLNRKDTKVAKRLNFTEVSTHGEIRISEELMKDENIFVSHLFKKEYLTYDKSNKGYLIKVDLELFKVFTKITKLIKINHMFNVNTVNDLYILQLMVLENDYNICFNQRDQVIIDLRKKEEILNSKQNEINHLEERLKIPSNDFNLSEMYEMEIKTIQQKLLEKSNELIRFEIIQSHKEKTNQARITQLIEKNKSLHEENCKMKELLREIASLENGTGSRSVTDRINSLLDDKNTNKSNLSMEEGIDDDSIEEENFLVTKVIGEFDKILDNEMKKVESYHRKDSNIIKRRSSAVKFKSSGERNYIEWKTRNSAATWADSLRGRSDNKSQVDKNVNEMKRLSKLRIKNSIVADSKLLEQTLKSDVDLSRSDIYTLSEVYCNRLMTKSSSPSKRYCKRIESNDKLWREKIDKDLRRLVFSYKKK